MKIAVMGAGGIGGYVGARFAEAGAEVSLVARGAHLEALRANGLRLESPYGDAHLTSIRATDDPAEIGVVDVVLFAVKMAHVDAAAARLGPLIGPDTRVVTFQNGIDVKDLLAKHVPEAQIAAGIIYLATHIKAPGVIFSPGGIHKTVIDALEGDATMARFFDMAKDVIGLDISPTDEIRRVLWDKFITLTAFSAVTCIARQPVGAVYAHPPLLAFFRALLAENTSIAAAEGIPFPETLPDDKVELLRGQPYGQKSSMLIDLEAGKPLELPWLSGRIVELGAKHGIPVPANSAAVAALSPYVDGPPKLPD